MNTRTISIITISSSVIAAILVSILFNILFNKNSDTKTAYIKLGEIYDGFELTKQLSKKITETENARKNILDSIEFKLKAMQMRIGNSQKADKFQLEEFELNKETYFLKKEQFSEDNAQMVNQYNQQIWNQLNQFISDFGKEKGYTYVFGAEGGGAIMYGRESEDITQQVIEYVNKKFQGK